MIKIDFNLERINNYNNCNAEIKEKQKFCTQCGTKYEGNPSNKERTYEKVVPT